MLSYDAWKLASPPDDPELEATGVLRDCGQCGYERADRWRAADLTWLQCGRCHHDYDLATDAERRDEFLADRDREP